MGNMTSYIKLPPMAGGGGGGSVKVVHADGRVTRVAAAAARAAEVMADHPGQFLCEAARLAVGCRVPGVGADEVLSPRAAYFLLPLDMLYSVLTHDEMAALSAASHGAAAPSPWKRIVITSGRRHGRRRIRQQRIGNNGDADGRVFPVVGLMEQIRADNGGGGGDAAARVVVKPGGGGGGGLMRRQHRAWRRALDTIDEAP